MKQAGQCGVTLLFFRNVFKWLWIRTCRYQYVDTLSCRHTSLATAGRTIASEHHRGCAMVRPQWQALYRQFAHPPSPTRMGVLRNAFARGRREICVARALLCRFWASWFAHRHGNLCGYGPQQPSTTLCPFTGRCVCGIGVDYRTRLCQRQRFITAIRKRAPTDGVDGQFL